MKKVKKKRPAQPDVPPPSRRSRVGHHVPVVALALIALLVGVSWVVARVSSAEPKMYGYKIVAQYPHDPMAFTQGLVYDKGGLFESTGLNGHSTLRQVDLKTGRALKSVRVAETYFAEGLAMWGDQLVQLTWRSGVGFVYDKRNFEQIREFRYEGEGWGLTQDGKSLIMSDGTSTLRFLDPQTFAVVKTVDVMDMGKPVTELNELEYVKGEIYANIWKTNRIVRISPRDGKVTGWIDLEGLLPKSDAENADVLNGIAYDPDGDRLFVTGKLWPKMFQIELVRK